MKRLNLAFHKIKKQPNGDWEISPNTFIRIYEWCEKKFPSFSIYFDDGDILELPRETMTKIALKTTLAIVTDNVGKAGFYKWDELSTMENIGFKIASHTVSHPSLAWYGSDNQIGINPLGSEYIGCPRGKQILSERQIRFQLVESKKSLIDHGLSINEIVFPYGLYSQQTLVILDKLGIYKTYSTCDERLDIGRKVRPRILIYGTKSFEEAVKCLTKIIEK